MTHQDDPIVETPVEPETRVCECDGDQGTRMSGDQKLCVRCGLLQAEAKPAVPAAAAK